MWYCWEDLVSLEAFTQCVEDSGVGVDELLSLPASQMTDNESKIVVELTRLSVDKAIMRGEM